MVGDHMGILSAVVFFLVGAVTFRAGTLLGELPAADFRVGTMTTHQQTHH